MVIYVRWNLKKAMGADVVFSLDGKKCNSALPVCTEIKNLHKARIIVGKSHADMFLHTGL